MGAGGLARLLRVFNTQRCLNASISLGLAEAAFEESARYMRDRPAFGRRIGDFQGMRWKLADMYREIEAARGLLYRASADADPYPDPVAAALAKIACNEMSIRVTSEAVQIHGGNGLSKEYVIEKIMRDARASMIEDGTNEALLLRGAAFL